MQMSNPSIPFVSSVSGGRSRKMNCSGRITGGGSFATPSSSNADWPPSGNRAAAPSLRLAPDPRFLGWESRSSDVKGMCGRRASAVRAMRSSSWPRVSARCGPRVFLWIGRPIMPAAPAGAYPFRPTPSNVSGIGSKEAHTATTQDETWAALREAGTRQAGQCRLDLAVNTYSRRWECLDGLTTAYILRTLRQLGAFGVAGESHTLDSLLQACGIGGGFRRLVDRWLQRLAAAGYVQKSAASYAVHPAVARSGPGFPQRGSRRGIWDRPQHSGLRAFLRRSAGSDPFRTAEPARTLFPGGSFAVAESIYEHAPMSAYFNTIARSVLEAILRARGNSPLQVFEIEPATAHNCIAGPCVAAGIGLLL